MSTHLQLVYIFFLHTVIFRQHYLDLFELFWLAFGIFRIIEKSTLLVNIIIIIISKIYFIIS